LLNEYTVPVDPAVDLPIQFEYTNGVNKPDCLVFVPSSDPETHKGVAYNCVPSPESTSLHAAVYPYDADDPALLSPHTTMSTELVPLIASERNCDGTRLPYTAVVDAELVRS
jgi:hypothetical protein